MYCTEYCTGYIAGTGQIPYKMPDNILYNIRGDQSGYGNSNCVTPMDNL